MNECSCQEQRFEHKGVCASCLKPFPKPAPPSAGDEDKMKREVDMILRGTVGETAARVASELLAEVKEMDRTDAAQSAEIIRLAGEVRDLKAYIRGALNNLDDAHAVNLEGSLLRSRNGIEVAQFCLREALGAGHREGKET